MPEVKTSLDAVVIFSGIVAVWMVVWYTLGKICDILFVRRMKMEQKNRDIALNKTISLLHAIYATVHAWYYFNYFAHDALDQRYHCTESTWRSWRRLYPAGFVGYLVLDFFMELQKKKPGVLMLVHHAIFTTVAALSLIYEKGCLQYTVTLMSEATTIVFIVRWFMIATKQSQSYIKLTEYVFGLMFLGFRVFFFGHGTWVSVTEDPEVFADWSAWQFVPAMYILGYVMQLFWMYEIVMMALKPKRKDA